jgi:hypothetical protein
MCSVQRGPASLEACKSHVCAVLLRLSVVEVVATKETLSSRGMLVEVTRHMLVVLSQGLLLCGTFSWSRTQQGNGCSCV